MVKYSYIIKIYVIGFKWVLFSFYTWQLFFLKHPQVIFITIKKIKVKNIFLGKNTACDSTEHYKWVDNIGSCYATSYYSSFLKDFYFIFEREKEHEWGWSRRRGRSKILTEQGAWLGAWSQDHDLGQRQMLNWLSHPGTSSYFLLKVRKYLIGRLRYWMLQKYTTKCLHLTFTV